MSARAGMTGDAGGTDKPVASPGAHAVPGASVPPLLGYLQVPLPTSDRYVEQLRRELADYARREGFALCNVFVDRSRAHTTGFAELINALHSGQAGHVVVPALYHFGHFSSVRLAMKELLVSQSGARVLVMYSGAEE